MVYHIIHYDWPAGQQAVWGSTAVKYDFGEVSRVHGFHECLSGQG